MYVGAVIAGQGRRRGDSGPGVRLRSCAAVAAYAAVAAPGPCPGGRSGVTRVNDSSRFATPRDLGGRGSLRGKTHRRWPVECCAVGVQRRPVHHGVTRSTVPAGVPAATVPEAGHMPNEDLIRPKGVPVVAAGWRVGRSTSRPSSARVSPSATSAYVEPVTERVRSKLQLRVGGL